MQSKRYLGFSRLLGVRIRALIMAVCVIGCVIGGPNVAWANNEPAETFVISGDESRESVIMTKSWNGSTINEVALATRQGEVEVLSGFRADGTKILEYTSSGRSRSGLTAEQSSFFLMQGGKITLHNHPNIGSFSARDIYTAAVLDLDASIVIDGMYMYVWVASDSGYGEADTMQQRFDELRWQYEDEAHERIDAMTYNPSHAKAELELEARTGIPVVNDWDPDTIEYEARNKILATVRANPDGRVFRFELTPWALYMAASDVAREYHMGYRRVKLTDDELRDVDILQLIDELKAEANATEVTESH